MRPLVGITQDMEQCEGGAWKTYVDKAYQDAVYASGGMPVLLPIIVGEARLLAGLVDGILFTGGEDIHPRWYGEEITAPMDLSPEVRTGFERELMEAALELGRPVLGICLGIQAMNVYRGGSIVQDMEGHKQKGAALRHDIEVVEGSLLNSIAGATRAKVNSTHHQSLGRIGEGLVVSATAPDGVIEAVEMPGERFALGVQWHPEKMPDDPVSRALFAAFVEACSNPPLFQSGVESKTGHR